MDNQLLIFAVAIILGYLLYNQQQIITKVEEDEAKEPEKVIYTYRYADIYPYWNYWGGYYPSYYGRRRYGGRRHGRRRR